MDKFERDNAQQLGWGRKLVMLHAKFWPISEIVSSAQMLFVFFMGALMAINGEITVGDYLAVAGLVIWIIWPMLRGGGRWSSGPSTHPSRSTSARLSSVVVVADPKLWLLIHCQGPGREELFPLRACFAG